VFRDELPTVDGAHARLGVIQDRGSLRVGYLPDSLPFAYSNSDAEVVGFDIELAHHLAADLGVTLELVRIPYDEISEHLESGVVDMVMSGLAVTPGRALQWKFSASPLDLTLGLLVPDHRRKAFASLDNMRRMPDLKLGVVQSDNAFRHLIESAFPGVAVSYVGSPRKFLRGQQPELDAVVYSAEAGSAWTLIYPAYSVVVPRPGLVKLSTGYPLPATDPAWAEFVSDWIVIKQKDGTIGLLFEHWIMGRGAEDTEPRWSVIRDVLHWVE
jgi:ABC-type amino acid transport substrate-binding protein